MELSVFVVGVFLQLLGLPFVSVSQVSLFSKVTGENTQGQDMTGNGFETRAGGNDMTKAGVLSLWAEFVVRVCAGFSQGVRRSVGGLATILGPLWAGGLTANLYVMLGMMLFLLTLITVSPRSRS